MTWSAMGAIVNCQNVATGEMWCPLNSKMCNINSALVLGQLLHVRCIHLVFMFLFKLCNLFNHVFNIHELASEENNETLFILQKNMLLMFKKKYLFGLSSKLDNLEFENLINVLTKAQN